MGSTNPLSKPVSSRSLRIVSLTAAIVTYLLIILGSTVRVTHSGMGCPGWPLCYGQIGPVDRFHSIMEQSHRYLATIVTILVFITAWIAWKQARRIKRVLIPALISAGVILLQVLLGAITVITHNAPITVALHLATGMLELGIVTTVAVSAYIDPDNKRTEALDYLNDKHYGSFRAYGISAVVAIFIIIISGSIVVDGGAERSCPTWPLCNFRDTTTPLVVIQLVHRGVVLLGSMVVLLVVMQAWRRWTLPMVRPLALIVLCILMSQVTVGAFDAILKAPASLQDIHLALASALWVAVVSLVTVVWSAFVDQRIQKRQLILGHTPVAPLALDDSHSSKSMIKGT